MSKIAKMKRWSKTACCALCFSTLAVNAAIANASEPQHYKIDEFGWEVGYSDGTCSARALFKSPESSALIELRTDTPGKSFEAIVAAPDLNRPLAKTIGDLKDWEPTFRLRSSDEAHRIPSVGWAKTDNGEIALISLYLFQGGNDLDKVPEPTSSNEAHRVRYEQYSQIEGFYFDDLFRQDAFFETGPLDKMMNLMDSCEYKILESWGISPDVDRSLSQRLRILNLRQVIDDLSQPFPNNAQKGGTAVRMNVHLLVDERGDVTACEASPATPPAYAEPACAVLKRDAKFDPALDASGKPVGSYYSNSIVYIMSRTLR